MLCFRVAYLTIESSQHMAASSYSLASQRWSCASLMAGMEAAACAGEVGGGEHDLLRIKEQIEDNLGTLNGSHDRDYVVLELLNLRFSLLLAWRLLKQHSATVNTMQLILVTTQHTLILVTSTATIALTLMTSTWDHMMNLQVQKRLLQLGQLYTVSIINMP